MNNPIIKRILCSVAGIFTAVLLIFLFEMLSMAMHAVPQGIKENTPEGMKAMVASMPTSAFLTLICSYTLGCFAGGFVATKLYKLNLLCAIIVGVALLIFTLLNFVSIPHPLWVAVASCVMVPVSAWLGGRMALRGMA